MSNVCSLVRSMEELEEVEDMAVYYDRDKDFWDKLYNFTEYYQSAWDGIPEKIAASWLRQVLSPLFVCVGVPLCILNAKILRRLSARYLPTCTYLVVTSVVDSVLLLVVSGNAWLDTWIHRDIMKEVTTFSSGACKFTVYLLRLFYQLSNWSVVCYVFTTHCHVTGSCCGIHWNFSNVTDMMVFILVLLMCFNSQYFWTYDIVDFDAHSLVMPSAEDMNFGSLGLVQYGKICMFEAHAKDKADPHPEYYYLSSLFNILVTELIPVLMVTAHLVIVARQHYLHQKFAPGENGGQAPRWDWLKLVLIHGLVRRTPIALCLLQITSCLPLFLYVVSEKADAFYHGDAPTPQAQSLYQQARWNLFRMVFLHIKLLCMLLRFPLYCCTSFQFLAMFRHILQNLRNRCIGRNDSLQTIV